MRCTPRVDGHLLSVYCACIFIAGAAAAPQVQCDAKSESRSACLYSCHARVPHSPPTRGITWRSPWMVEHSCSTTYHSSPGVKPRPRSAAVQRAHSAATASMVERSNCAGDSTRAPPSPCTGSMSTAAVLGPILDRMSSQSPNLAFT